MEPKKTVRIYQNQPVSRPSVPSVGDNKVEIHVKGGSIRTSGAGGFAYGTPTAGVTYGVPKVVTKSTDASEATTVTLTGQSKFNGSAWGLFGLTLLSFFVIVISLGFAMPWAICKKQRWLAEHTTIDGLHVVFEGTAGDIFWRTIGWTWLIGLTLGLYSYCAQIKLQKWITENTYLIP